MDAWAHKVIQAFQADPSSVEQVDLTTAHVIAIRDLREVMGLSTRGVGALLKGLMQEPPPAGHEYSDDLTVWRQCQRAKEMDFAFRLPTKPVSTGSVPTASSVHTHTHTHTQTHTHTHTHTHTQKGCTFACTTGHTTPPTLIHHLSYFVA
jgi:hypothetical protein